MDVNGLRCWQVADATGFGLGGTTPPPGLHWRMPERAVRLASQQDAPTLAEDRPFAMSMAAKASPTADPGGSFAWWDGAMQTLQAAGFGNGATPITLPPEVPIGVPQPTDLAYGADEILYVARNDAVTMTDRRDRFADARISLAGFRAHRLAPCPAGGVWVLDRNNGKLALLSGQPLRRGGYQAPDAEAFRPVEPNPRPPRLRRIKGAGLPPGREGVAMAASPGGRVAVLAWVAGADAELFVMDDPLVGLIFKASLDGLVAPYSLAFIGEAQVALLASDGKAPAPHALVYDITDTAGAAARPTGEVWPLLGLWNGGFVNALGDVPRYPVAASNPDRPTSLRRLRAVSRPRFARSGAVTLGPFDAGRPGAVWHRLMIEAQVPDHAGVRVWAHADDVGAVPSPPGAVGAPDWSPHIIGDAAVDGVADAARASWCDTPSEFAFAPALLACPNEPGKSGRFDVLLQRPGVWVRRIAGRYLYLRLELLGDSLASPEVAAIRAYGTRFSYRDRYLPGLYHETVAGPDGALPGSATPPDFLERFVHLFEAPLTGLEGQVADSWLLTDPGAAPEAALPWLGQWIGMGAEAGGDPQRLRQRLRAAPWTARLHGTLGGLMAALELATGGQVVSGGQLDPDGHPPRPGQLALAAQGNTETKVLVLGIAAENGVTTVLSGGAVTGGDIVVVEGFRLRRTFSTILGADLDDNGDPLTLGGGTSGNSFVGDSLILGDAARREITAAFAASLPQSGADRAAVTAFFQRLAWTVMVLVRATPQTSDMARLTETADAAAPAHVMVNLLPATRPLIVGAASLVGIDTYLSPAPPVNAVRVGRSRVGEGDRVMGTGRLDPRADGPVSARPVAVADGPATAFAGQPFLLSASRSAAARGRTIARHIWTRI